MKRRGLQRPTPENTTLISERSLGDESCASRVQLPGGGPAFLLRRYLPFTGFAAARISRTGELRAAQRREVAERHDAHQPHPSSPRTLKTATYCIFYPTRAVFADSRRQTSTSNAGPWCLIRPDCDAVLQPESWRLLGPSQRTIGDSKTAGQQVFCGVIMSH